MSALTLDDLKNELRNTPSFKPVLKAQGGSGGGASGNLSGGAAKNPKTMTMQQRAEWLAKDPLGFEEAVKRGEFN